ncbi:MAG: domain protein beta Propeller [Fibrobacteres bacterium]|nr:domain protein beta Propeller [Fibrobacterota bacterium]
MPHSPAPRKPKASIPGFPRPSAGWAAAILIGLAGQAAHALPPKGAPVQPEAAETVALQALTKGLKGKIIWSTSRDANHDIYIANIDGSDAKPLTKGPKTDWYSHFSPDGKVVLFTRSKIDWTIETDANYPERWDTWTINADGSGEKLLIPNSTWANWTRDGKSIVYSRGPKVYKCNADGAGEALVADMDLVKKGSLAQHPSLSDDGKLLAVTLRGSGRETGIYNLETKTYFTSGGGCQFSFFPNAHRCIRVNETGIGGTSIFAFDLKPDGTHGKIDGGKIDGKSIVFMDMPGRRSHSTSRASPPKGITSSGA